MEAGREQFLLDGHLGLFGATHCWRGEAWVKVPVAREFWDQESERETLRAVTRRALADAVFAETGIELDATFLARLPVMVEDPVEEEAAEPQKCEVLCVGGPRDGTRLTLDRPHPGLMVELPLDHFPLSLDPDLIPKAMHPRAQYVPIVDDDGQFSRADDGAWRFRHDGDR